MRKLITDRFLPRANPGSLAWLVVVIGAMLMWPPSATPGEPTVLYATGTLEIRSQPSAKEKPVGRLIVAAPLLVLERASGWLRVETRGWYQEGARRILYALPGKRILNLVLRRSATGGVRTLNSVNDPDTGLAWTEAAYDGWIRDESVTAELESIWAAAWELFATRCTVCHQRRIPDRYTANQWGALLKVMGPRTGLPKEQQQLILKYLQHHARDTGNRRAGNVP